MLTIYSDDHHLHHGRCELIDGQLMPCFEKPERADFIHERVLARQLGPIEPARDWGLAPIARVHDQGMLDFLQGAWARWRSCLKCGPGANWAITPSRWGCWM